MGYYQKTILQVASWTDKQGLSLITAKYEQLHSPVSIDTNKTYVITTILQEPFMMLSAPEYGQRGDQFHGFCKDLADMVTAKLGIKCE